MAEKPDSAVTDARLDDLGKKVETIGRDVESLRAIMEQLARGERTQQSAASRELQQPAQAGNDALIRAIEDLRTDLQTLSQTIQASGGVP